MKDSAAEAIEFARIIEHFGRLIDALIHDSETLATAEGNLIARKISESEQLTEEDRDLFLQLLAITNHIAQDDCKRIAETTGEKDKIKVLIEIVRATNEAQALPVSVQEQIICLIELSANTLEQPKSEKFRKSSLLDTVKAGETVWIYQTKTAVGKHPRNLKTDDGRNVIWNSSMLAGLIAASAWFAAQNGKVFAEGLWISTLIVMVLVTTYSISWMYIARRKQARHLRYYMTEPQAVRKAIQDSLYAVNDQFDDPWTIDPEQTSGHRIVAIRTISPKWLPSAFIKLIIDFEETNKGTSVNCIWHFRVEGLDQYWFLKGKESLWHSSVTGQLDRFIDTTYGAWDQKLGPAVIGGAEFDLLAALQKPLG